jgi:hypothetical protein
VRVLSVQDDDIVVVGGRERGKRGVCSHVRPNRNDDHAGEQICTHLEQLWVADSASWITGILRAEGQDLDLIVLPQECKWVIIRVGLCSR